MSGKYIKDSIEIEGIEYDIFIGKNALGNEDIIKISMENNKDSIWFHFDNISSPHIILDNKGNKLDKKSLKKVGMLLYKYKKNVPENTKIIYTKVKHLSMTKEVGSVIPKNYNFL
jgi:predicted ribosome quality control (RQC) complex YloA/Tae2 family protein